METILYDFFSLYASFMKLKIWNQPQTQNSAEVRRRKTFDVNGQYENR